MSMETVTAHRSLKEKQREEREELILRVAEEVLMEKGYYDTSIDEIAARVGIAKGTVYLHFPGKEELVVKIFQRDMQEFLQLVENTIASEITTRAKLQAILQFMYSSLFSKRIQLLYTLYSSADLRRIFVEKKGCIFDIGEQLSVRISALLEEGKATGEFDPGLPTPVMVAAFFSLLTPKSYGRLMVKESDMSLDELVKYLAQIYFKGIAAV